jgi:2-succinyl-5-enolpyruvyl-6-hydroxy-3-cyclohexene-1-carboxylate synthase
MSTEHHTRNLTLWVAALVDGLVRGGADRFVVCPGSRSTPLALAIARHPLARLWVHMDERSAGFFALGMAKRSGAPVVLLCTSGTAAANFLPAVAEADLSRVPLIVLTADRPHELRDNGAPQTIDQVRLFGQAARWFSDLPTPEGTPELLRYARAAVARALDASHGPPAGPVHLNLPFREPLVPDAALLAELYAAEQPPVALARGRARLEDSELVDLAMRLEQRPRGLILCGPECPPQLTPAVVALAARLGYPVLADPLSGVRCGPHGSQDEAQPHRELVLSAYDAFLRDEGFAARHRPDVVLRFGAMPTAKPVLQYLQRHSGTELIVVDSGAGWREPTSLATLHLRCDERWLCEALPDCMADQAAPDTSWSEIWVRAEAAAREAIAQALGGRQAISEPGVFAELAELLPDGSTLFVGNSMPVRDCDTFFPASERRVTIMGNRGANGIDGLVSTALGAVAAGARPLVLALGDLSLYHDANGLLAARLYGLSATIVLINNDGGGIFSFLPQASEADQFERLFGTPHGLDFRHLAELYGARYTLAASWEGFRSAVGEGLSGEGLHIVEVRTTRQQNVADHRTIWPQVSAALARAGLR